MIRVTRLDKQTMYVNPDHIVSMVETPDTVITLFNGHHFIIRETIADIVDRIVAFRSNILRRSGTGAAGTRSTKTRKRRFHCHTFYRNFLSVDEQSNNELIPFHSRDN